MKNKVNRPNYDIEFDGKIIPKKQLHFTSQNIKDQIFFVDSKTDCIVEFKVKGKKLYDWFTGQIERGRILSKKSTRK